VGYFGGMQLKQLFVFLSETPPFSPPNKTMPPILIFLSICNGNYKYTLENTEGAIINGQSRGTGNIGYTRRRKTKQNKNTICVEQNNTLTNTKT
jgi:hypothetical protein